MNRLTIAQRLLFVILGAAVVVGAVLGISRGQIGGGSPPTPAPSPSLSQAKLDCINEYAPQHYEALRQVYGDATASFDARIDAETQECATVGN